LVVQKSHRRRAARTPIAVHTSLSYDANPTLLTGFASFVVNVNPCRQLKIFKAIEHSFENRNSACNILLNQERTPS
jgi:hypothetical protein